jgi:hypothetical protein
MMAITTSNSTKVKPLRIGEVLRVMIPSLGLHIPCAG